MFCVCWCLCLAGPGQAGRCLLLTLETVISHFRRKTCRTTSWTNKWRQNIWKPVRIIVTNILEKYLEIKQNFHHNQNISQTFNLSLKWTLSLEKKLFEATIVFIVLNMFGFIGSFIWKSLWLNSLRIHYSLIDFNFSQVSGRKVSQTNSAYFSPKIIRHHYCEKTNTKFTYT